MPEEPATSVRDSPDSAYRRGTVLGLTVAEVFILLLFLLMLVFLALAQEWETEIGGKPTNPARELQVAKSILEDVRQVVEEYEESIPVPDEPVPLERGEESEIQTSHDSSVDSENSLPEDIRALLDRASDAIQEEKIKAEQAEKRAEKAETARDEAQAIATRAGRTLDVLREKGHNPPCWYQRVSDVRGGDRERPYYTFEVTVFDNSMVLRQVSAPPGGATDDEGSSYSSYAEEARALQLDRLPYNAPLSDSAVVAALQPVHDAGKEENVRTYACIFWARVWDQTSPDAKERWKSAHDGILESLLGTYTVSEDPWED